MTVYGIEEGVAYAGRKTPWAFGVCGEAGEIGYLQGRMIARFFFRGAVRIVGFYFSGPPWVFVIVLISLAVLLLGFLSISGLGGALRTLASGP